MAFSSQRSHCTEVTCNAFMRPAPVPVPTHLIASHPAGEPQQAPAGGLRCRPSPPPSVPTHMIALDPTGGQQQASSAPKVVVYCKPYQPPPGDVPIEVRSEGLSSLIIRWWGEGGIWPRPGCLSLPSRGVLMQSPGRLSLRPSCQISPCWAFPSFSPDVLLGP